MFQEQAVTVLYHADADGFCSAWIASKYIESKDVEYIPVQYGQDPPWEQIECRDVFILDFSYKRPVMEQIIERAASMVCLDHHKTAEAELVGLQGCHFDMDKAGCRMTLDFFEQRGLPNGDEWKSEPFRRIVEVMAYVEDRDLWRFKLPASKAVNAEIHSWQHTFDEWDAGARNGIDAAMVCGESILRSQQRQVENILKNARPMIVDGYVIWGVNTPVLISECAGELASRFYPISNSDIQALFGVAWFVIESGEVVVSLRSRRDDFDVSAVAQKYGGGGHAKAAGFTTTLETIYAMLKAMMDNKGDGK